MDQTSPLVNIFDGHLFSINSFFSDICNTPIQTRSEYHVEELTWYKHTKGSQHEFIVAKLTNSIYVRVDREPPADANSLQISSTSSASSLDSKSLPAGDVIHIFPRNSPTLKNIVTSKNFMTVCECTFTAFHVLEFARLLVAISDSEPEYTITGTMCYWYASRIVALSTHIFSGIERKRTNGLGGQWRGILKFNDDTGLDDIKGRYIQARDADPEPIGPKLRLPMQATDEANRKANKERWLREEADRKADEANRKADEANRKADEERWLREEADRKADEANRKADEERLLREMAVLELERYKALAGHREGH